MKWFALRTVAGLVVAVAALLAVGLALDGAAFAGEAPPWGKAENLGERMTLEKTAVCTDGKSHYVVVAPSEKQSTQLYYGDGKTFYRVPLPPWVLTRRQLLRAALLREDQELELPRAWTCACSRRSTTTRRRRPAAPAAASARPT